MNEENNELLRSGIFFTIVVIVCIWLFGCCTAKPPIIETKVDTVYIYNTQTDTLTLAYFDTIWQASDPNIIIRVDTAWKKLWYKWSDTVRYTHTDTTTITKEIIVEYSLFDKLKLVLITLGCVLIIFAAIKLIRG